MSMKDYEEIDSVEWSDESYAFDLTGIFRHTPTGRVYYVDDQGCSCPEPFDQTDPGELVQIKRLQDWYDHVEERLNHRISAAVDESESARRTVEDALIAWREAGKP